MSIQDSAVLWRAIVLMIGFADAAVAVCLLGRRVSGPELVQATHV